MLGPLFSAVAFLLSIYQWVIIINALSSWLPIDKSGKIFEYLRALTEPALNPIRNFISKSSFLGNLAMFDLSPIVLYLLVGFLKNVFEKLSYSM